MKIDPALKQIVMFGVGVLGLSFVLIALMAWYHEDKCREKGLKLGAYGREYVCLDNQGRMYPAR